MRLPELLDSRVTPLRSLLFQFTRYCPLECGHCYIKASPRERKVLSLDVVKETIDACHSVTKGFTVGFTGGEPFSRISYLREALEFTRSRDLPNVVNTSGFFAKSPNQALRILESLTLDHLEVSLDRYHLNFQPLNLTRNCIEAAQKLRLRTTLCLLSDDFESNTGGIRDYAESLVGIEIRKQDLIPDRKLSNFTPSRGQFSPCSSAFNIVVDQDGWIFPCCNAEMIGAATDKTKPKFAVGHVGENNTKKILSETINSKSLQITSLRGPGAACVVAGCESEGLNYCEACVKARGSEHSISENLMKALKFT